MKPFRFQHKKGSLSLFGKAVSVAAVLLIGLVAYLASSPEAHEFFHPDAGHEDHECVVTSFAAGEGLYLAPQIDLQPATVVVQWVHFEAVEVLRNSSVCLLPPVCGPPVRSLTS
jgi:hypothetical protein